MESRLSTQKVVIIGSGISGAATARELIKQGARAENIIVLEKENRVGGKIRTYSDTRFPTLKAEYGPSVFTVNYGVIDDMYEHRFSLESGLPIKRDSSALMENFDRESTVGKFRFATEFAYEMGKFANAVRIYNNACDSFQPTPPNALDHSFAEFIEEHQLNKTALFMQLLGNGFGYGPNEKNTAHRMLAYMGYTTIPALTIGAATSYNTLVSLQGGFQQLVEAMLSKIDVRLGVNILDIKRDEQGAHIHYQKNGVDTLLDADLLVVATSPYYWHSFGMALSPEEQACVEALNYYRYPTVICRLKGAPAQQVYVKEALQEPGFGHVAFLTTRDARQAPEEGRLFTAYINLPPGENSFSLEPSSSDYASILADLHNIPGVTEATIVDATICPDYNPTVPWAVGIALQKAELQHAQHTLHIGTFLPGSFETLAGADEYARKAVARWVNAPQPGILINALTDLQRTYRFFTMPIVKPVDDAALLSNTQVSTVTPAVL